MQTKELFREDSYLKSCEATVLAVLDNGVILDQTVFYPLGGGQPGDTGTITTQESKILTVTDSRKSKEHPQAIVHFVDLSAHHLAVGERVTLAINWQDRYRYMRMHTCLHVFCSLLKFPVTGGNISLEKGRLDFDMPDSPDKDALTIKLNALLDQSLDVSYQWITDQQMQANMDLVRTMSVQPPMGLGRVRLVNIPGIDLQPCGGTHVKNLSEIGHVEITKIENKGKQNRRIILQLID